MTSEQIGLFLSQAGQFDSPARHLRNRLIQPANYKTAAVLLAIVRHREQWQILLTRRSDALRHHTGQIAFAGGRQDPDDPSLTHTALRETAEEVGILAQYWQTFPVLPPHYSPSGYQVYPVPALCLEDPIIQTNPDEVAEVFYLPFDFAMNLHHYRPRKVHHNGQTFSTPALPYLHYDIWGLTAIILYGLAERYQQYCRSR